MRGQGQGPHEGGAGVASCQMPVAGIRCRPRSGHRTAEDTRITSYRDGGTTAAVRIRTALLPSLGLISVW